MEKYLYLRSPNDGVRSDGNTSVARKPGDDPGEINRLIEAGWRFYDPSAVQVSSKMDIAIAALSEMNRAIDQVLRNLVKN